MMDINREIAEKVMGWNYVIDGLASDEAIPTYEDSDVNFKYIATNWNPEVNISHAMEVEAEMFRRGFYIRPQRGNDGAFYVGFTRRGEWTPVQKSESLPEAICLAALNAVNDTRIGG
jgi:hypothetical protein